MRSQRFSRLAFTLLEVTIVILIMAIMTATLAWAFRRSQVRSQFDAQVTEIVGLFQEARALSLSQVIVNGTDPADHYILTVEQNELRLEAAYDSGSETLDNISLDYNWFISLNGQEAAEEAIEFFYYPPEGDICIAGDCSNNAETAAVFYLVDDENELSTQFTVSVFGGYPELLESTP